MRHLFIINPAAGKRRSSARLEELLGKLSFPCERVYTSQAGDARRFAEEAVRQGEPVRIYACGGDGTLNEVVNGAFFRPGGSGGGPSDPLRPDGLQRPFGD